MPSVGERLGDAVAAVAAAYYACPVRVRKLPDLLDGETPPLVVVSVLEDETAPLQFEETAGDEVTYVVQVTLVLSTAGTAADDEDARTWKENVRSRLHDPTLSGMPEVTDTTILRRPPFPRPASQVLSYTAVAVEYQCAEDRG